MIVSTKHFGDIDVANEEIISFEEGLPGFEDTRKYIIISDKDEKSPFKWLQCVDMAELAFVIIDPFVVRTDYEIDVTEDVVQSLRIADSADVTVYAIVVVPEDVGKTSLNLKAPVIVNTKNMKAVQMIMNTDKYTVRHYIMDELARQEVGANAGTDTQEK